MAAAAGAAAAQPEPDRRLAAELAVMQGDLRRLRLSDTPAAHRRGLALRLSGALASLRLLVRRTGAEDDGAVERLRGALGDGDLDGFAAGLDHLAARFPLDLSALLPPRMTPDRLEAGRALHEQICAGCHDAADPDSMLPAFPLRHQARSMPPAEFAARLIAGVRGTAATALANPLTEAQIAALLAYYLADAAE